jgi:hypothetical protein
MAQLACFAAKRLPLRPNSVETLTENPADTASGYETGAHAGTGLLCYADKFTHQAEARG